MANKKVSAVNLLPEYFKTLKNTKFLSSTLDKLIQPADLESIDGYVGSQNTPTYKPTDNYISNGNPYQLDPALIFYDNLQNIQGAQGYDDFLNEIAANGGYTNNLDRLLRSKVYSYNAHIDWDKLVNYQNYFWLLLKDCSQCRWFSHITFENLLRLPNTFLVVFFLVMQIYMLVLYFRSCH